MFRITVDYAPSIDGIPVPRKVTIVVEPGQLTREWEFTDVQFVGTPESEFTLAAFGLPELTEPPREGWSEAPLGSWIIALGAGGLIIAFILYFLAKRGESRRATRLGSTNG